MCGRVCLSSDVGDIKLVFSIPPHRSTPNFPPSWNAAPTDSLPVVRYDGKVGERSLDLLRWGLVPFWARDLKVGFANINAKAEGIETRPAFREAFERRRCLVPVDSFYEWKKIATGKQPYAIALANGSLMALAGLWETGARRSANGCGASRSSPPRRTNYARSFTTACRWSSSLKPGRSGWEKDPANASSLKALLAPVPSDEMTCWPVSARVGNVRNNEPSLIERIAA
jgi:putative SOS response-associated peptidase YedK